MIHFTKHATEKFDILERHNVCIGMNQIKEALLRPVNTTKRGNKFFADMVLGSQKILRVCYKKEGDDTRIITFYPIKKK